MNGTTIHITQGTKKRLDKLKVHKRETYEEVLKRVIDEYEGKHKEN